MQSYTFSIRNIASIIKSIAVRTANAKAIQKQNEALKEQNALTSKNTAETNSNSISQ